MNILAGIGLGAATIAVMCWYADRAGREVEAVLAARRLAARRSGARVERRVLPSGHTYLHATPSSEPGPSDWADFHREADRIEHEQHITEIRIARERERVRRQMQAIQVAHLERLYNMPASTEAND